MLQSLFTSIIIKVLGWAMGWISKIYTRVQRMESERVQKSREAVERMMRFYSNLHVPRSRIPSGELDELTEMSREMALWAPDQVLVHYIAFLEKRSPRMFATIADHEIEFGKTILAFRHERGFRNKDNKLQPEQVAAIFKAGWDSPI